MVKLLEKLMFDKGIFETLKPISFIEIFHLITVALNVILRGH